MKKLYVYLFLVFFALQTPSSSDDIRDFQIEGMSIGDSLLDYYSKKILTTNTADYYKDNTYASNSFRTSASESLFESVTVSYLTDDKTFKAESISGDLDFPNNINDCYKKMDEVKESLMKSLPGIIPETKKTNKNSTYGVYTYINFIFDSGDQISVSCYDYDKKYPYADIFRLSLETIEFRNWIEFKAYE